MSISLVLYTVGFRTDKFLLKDYSTSLFVIKFTFKYFMIDIRLVYDEMKLLIFSKIKNYV